MIVMKKLLISNISNEILMKCNEKERKLNNSNNNE